MDLYVVRHAIAEERDGYRWPDDSQRPLTDRGRDRFRIVVEVMDRIAPPPHVMLSSRYVRAWQTAEILTEHADWPDPTPCPELEGAPSEAVCEVIADARPESVVAVVGHEPCLSELVAYLLTGDDSGMGMEFKKGGVAALRFPATPRPGGADLLWYLTPKMARNAG